MPGNTAKHVTTGDDVTHSKQIVVKQLGHTDHHVKGDWFKDVHHLHVFACNRKMDF